MRVFLKRTISILLLAALIVALLFTPALAAVNELVWKKFSSDATESKHMAKHMASDRNGNIVVAGIMVDGPAFIRKFSGGGRILWTRQFAGSGELDLVIIRGVATDDDGNIYVAGDTWLDGSYVSKYGPRGGHHWTRDLIRKSDAAVITGIDVGPGGNIYVVGNAFGSLPHMPSSSKPGDAFIRKYNPSGKIYWTRQFSLTDFQASTNAFDVAVGPGGGVYVVGVDHSEHRANDGLFLRKYSPRGGIYWTRRVSRHQPYFAYSGQVAVDRAGGVTLVGTSMNNAGVFGVAAVKYTHKGRRLWTRSRDGDIAGDVVVDRDRNIYVVGTSTGISDKAFVRKYGPGGTRRWTRLVARGFANGAATDAENNLYVTGPADTADESAFLAKFRR